MATDTPRESPPRTAGTWGWSSLAVRLVVAFMLLAGLALGVALIATTHAVEEAAEQKISDDLARTQEAFQRLAQATQDRLRGVADAQARDRTFKDVALTVNSDDSAAGLDDGDAELEGIQGAHEVILSADTEAFGWSDKEEERIWAFFNVRKRLVFTRGDDEQVGATVDGLNVLELALNGDFASELWSPATLSKLPFTFVPPETIRKHKEDLLLVHAHRVTTSGSEGARPIGVVLSGRWVKELLLKDSLEQGLSGADMQGARAHFALLSADGALATTFPDPRELSEALSSTPGETVETSIGNHHYLVRGNVFRDVKEKRIGRAFVMRDLDAEIDPILDGFRARLLPRAVGVMLLAFVLAVLLARRLSAPLVQLEAAARRVRLGSLDVEVPVQGTDEVGRLAGAFNEMVAGLRQRDQIQGLFKRYLAPQVVDELIRNPEKAAPGGERRELTVLFIDLVGFTSLSEEMSPEALVDLLNGYFERATEVLVRHGATLDKFIGDAIMCFWNAPLPQQDHAARACLTALGLLHVVDVLAPELQARGMPRLDCRIGINTGAGVVGNIGSRVAQDYTVIGDSVNLASRLEGAAKVYGTRTLVSEDTVREAGDAVLARELDWLRVKGRQLPVRVYELVDVGGAPPPAHLARFAEGLALYRARRFTEAREAFLASPGDAPSRVFAARCEALSARPPPEDWDGVFSLDTK
ncbi:adenylate/guanylate cyclase domain-containing protein [Archangium sp.]|uniref:adenylate/guanylate cyclase domain-containing protein n=1 Tax=Archangium sp. TaxID=1872627 RepID=UPI003899E06F